MPHYLWLDLETTGGIDTIDGHSVLELAFMVTTTDHLMIPVEVPRMVQSGTAAPASFLLDGDLSAMDDFVTEMHTKSHLLSDLETPLVPLTTPEVLDSVLVQSLSALFDDGLILAGSGVSRFDRQFLKRDFPELDSRLRYYEFDVSSLRRSAQMAGFQSWLPQRSLFGHQKPGTVHRAAEDVLDSWHTARTFYLNAVEAADGPAHPSVPSPIGVPLADTFV